MKKRAGNIIKTSFITSAIAAGLIAQAQLAAANPWNDMTTVGSAAITSGGNLQLTTDGNSETGAAWQNTPVSTLQSFTTTFSFSLISTANPQADGIAFVMQGQGKGAIGDAGGYIGADISKAVGSEIHTWYNNQVGFFQNGSPYTAKSAPFFMAGNNSLIGTETVSYDAASNFLTMTGTINGNSVSDSLGVNLDALFGSSMYVGFTGGTGGSYSDQEITDWSGINAAVPEPATMLLLGAGLIGLGGMVRRKRA